MAISRILYSDNGTITDHSDVLSRYASGVASIPNFVIAEDYLYIGQRNPFNHVFVKPGSTVNANGGKLLLEYWDGDEWISVVEVRDQTDVFNKAGWITWVPDKSRGWLREDTTSPASDPTGQIVLGLENIIIYDQYWLRIALDTTPSNPFELSFVGPKFSLDEDLAAEYPALDRQVFRDAFTETPGTKLDWEAQHVKAAQIMIEDMISRGIIWNKGQILTRDKLILPSVFKVAEIIFNALGEDYKDERDDARKEYYSRLTKGIYQTDKNRDAILDPSEDRARTGWLSR